MRIRYSFSSRRTGRIEGRNNHKKSFPDIVKEVIKNADILLEVLDARFIEDTRNLEVEAMISSQDKKLVYVLNKADLIETNQAREYMEENRLYPYVFVSCKERQGGKQLRERIKIEAAKVRKSKEEKIKKLREEKAKDDKEPNILDAIPQIGVVGYPNTGKSSIINLLIGKASARTAPTAGCTRGIQKIKLTEDIFIIDTPGALPSKENVIEKTDMTKQVKIGARDFDRVKNPENIVADLMVKYPHVIEKYYHLDIETKGDPELLIEGLGRKKSFLKKGNQVDLDRTCRLILRNWQEGKIKVN
ncbi:MAG: 50S ribosome-binding GTPase [Candidatus Pacearchaeota archaeon]|nr:50S ribosome-binding GTPase [Candidatus Pacearchaeota archaeon]